MSKQHERFPLFLVSHSHSQLVFAIRILLGTWPASLLLLPLLWSNINQSLPPTADTHAEQFPTRSNANSRTDAHSHNNVTWRAINLLKRIHNPSFPLFTHRGMGRRQRCYTRSGDKKPRFCAAQKERWLPGLHPATHASSIN